MFAHKPQKSWFDKKKDLLAEKQDLFEKKLRGKVHSQKKRFCDTKKQDLSEKKRGMIKTEKRRISSHPFLAICLGSTKNNCFIG